MTLRERVHRADQTKSLLVSDQALIPIPVQFQGKLYQTTCESQDPSLAQYVDKMQSFSHSPNLSNFGVKRLNTSNFD